MMIFKMIKRLLLLCVLLTSPLYGATYYVDATDGDDAKDGLSEANAWKTIGKVNGETFSAGDSILFKKGEVWREQLNVSDSGGDGSPITYGNYGTGNDPIINGSDLVTTWTAAEGAFAEIWSAESQTGDSTWASSTKGANWSGRIFVKNASITASADKCKVVLQGDPDDTATISNVAIGPKGDGSGEDLFDYEGNVSGTNVQFSSSDSVEISAGTTATSDEVNFAIDDSTDYLVAIHISGASDLGYLIGSSPEMYQKDSAGDETETGDVSGYGAAGTLWTVDSILGSSAIGENIWQATLTTEPDQVFFDGTRGTKEVSAAACDAEFEWYWSGNILYAYSTSDPDTAYTSPGIEASVRDYCITGTTKTYITVDGVDVKHSNLNGIGVFTTSTNWIIQNLTSSYNYGGGIQIGAGSDDATIDNCTSEYNYSDGIGIGGVQGTAVDGVTISDCTCNNNLWRTGAGGAGIWAFHLDNSTISGCTVHSNESGGIRLDGGAAWGCDGNTITQNSVYQNGRAASPGQGDIHIEFSQSNVIERNHIYSGVETSEVVIAFARATGNTVRYNIIRDTTGSGRAGIKLQSGATDADIYNNVIHDCHYAIYLDDATDCNVKNNIVDASLEYDLYLTTTAYTNLDSNYNDFTGDGTAAIREAGVSNYTVAQHYSSKSQDQYSISSDPLFVDAVSLDFSLQPASPCRDVGTNVSLTEDYSGMIVPRGSGYDIGAYEYYLGTLLQPRHPTHPTFILDK